MGTGPMMSGSLDIDDSADTNASGANVTLTAAQTYTGATYVEAGTLTLNVANALADSSGVTLGRVGGAVDGQTAHLVLNADNQLTSLSDDASNTTSVVLNGHVLTLSPTSTSRPSLPARSATAPAARQPRRQRRRHGHARRQQYVLRRHHASMPARSNWAIPAPRAPATITFVDPPIPRTLKIDHEADPTNTISGFAAGDTIDLVGFDVCRHVGEYELQHRRPHRSPTASATAFTLNLTGNFSGEFFHADSFERRHRHHREHVACYCRGTLIHTDRGRSRVEKLKIGDKVKTASGAARPIKWIGRRSYGGRFILGRNDILPICIKAGALGDRVPRRDLWISPHHAMYFETASEGVLIEARDLVNGVSIVQAESVEQGRVFPHRARQPRRHHRQRRAVGDLHRRRQPRHVPQRA